MRKFAASIMVGGLLALTYTGQARAASKQVVACIAAALSSSQVLAGPCTGSTGVTIPAECDAAFDSVAECMATLLSQGYKLESSAGAGGSTPAVFHVFSKKGQP